MVMCCKIKSSRCGHINTYFMTYGSFYNTGVGVYICQSIISKLQGRGAISSFLFQGLYTGAVQ